MDGSRAFVFGPYRLEPGRRRLLRDGDPVPLTPKAFDVLVALIERHDRVVDKAELMKLVWPDSFVEEANLSQTVFVLRKTLGQAPDGAPFIETVPRRGYRFAAEVAEEFDRSVGSVQSTPVRRPRGWSSAVTVLALVAVAGMAAWQVWWSSQSPDASPGSRRIVVLPFENLTGDRGDDWLAGAFSDSITSGLQEVDTFVPVSRDRVVELYGQQGIREAAPIGAAALRRMTEALRAHYFVHGSYQKIGDQIKVSARLVAADTGTIEAQESVTDEFANLLRIEDVLAARFARRLQADARVGHRDAPHTSMDAYHAFVEGRTLYAQTRHQAATAPLTRATALDHNYAQAWALLAKNQARLATVTMLSSGNVDEMRRRALEYAQRAVAIAPALYDARVALALAYRENEHVQQWRVEALKAIELNPNLAEAYELVADSYFAGNAWGCARDRNAALAEKYFNAAIQRDPVWAAPYANLSYHFSWSGREDDALRTTDQGLMVVPNNPTLTRARALTLVRLGRPDAAETAIRQMLGGGAAMSAQDHLVLGAVALARGHLDVAAREFETASARLPTTTTFLALARAYLDAHQFETGLSYLDRAVALDPACAQFAVTTPAFAPHREAPQFRARLQRWRSSG